MAVIQLVPGGQVAVKKADLDILLSSLRELGYQIVGPRIKEAALVYAPIEGMADLPRGYLSEQDGGQYHLVNTIWLRMGIRAISISPPGRRAGNNSCFLRAASYLN